MSDARHLVVDLKAQAAVWSLTDDDAAALRAAAPPGWTVEFVQSRTVSDGDGNSAPSAEVRRAITRAQAYVGFGMPRALFVEGTRLEWVHSAAAGVGNVLFPEMLESGVVLTNSAGIHARPIAEHVLGGVIYLLRQFDVAVAQQRLHTWDREPFVGATSRIRELGECRALIIGAGGIGGEIARALGAHGVRSAGIRRRPEHGVPEGFETIHGPGELDALLPEADIVIIAAPATVETTGLVTPERLDHLPHDAIVVNIARGSLLDEEALAERLHAGRLGGALLDVFHREPLPADSVLWDTPRLLITPHVSATSPRAYWRRELSLIMENWSRFASGRPLRNVVDKHAGY